jgi:ribosome maturation factor RimP
MAAPSTVDAVRALVEPAVASAGLVIEDVELTPAGRRRVVRVIVDLPDDQLGGVSFDAIETASRAVSQAIDASTVMGEAPYTLEVSSPGIGRPLTQRRHWLRARRRTVKATLADGSTVEGRLTDVNDDGLVLDGRRLPWDGVVRGAVQVDFRRIEDDDPLDAGLEGEGDD